MNSLNRFFRFFSLFRFLFLAFDNGDGGAGGGAGDPKGEKPEDPKDKSKDNQEELNKQFAERAARAEEAARKKLLEDLGVTDPEEAKKLLKVARDAEAATKSETERLQADVQAAQAAKEKAEAEAKKSLAAATKKLMDADIVTAAFSPVMEKDKVTRPAFRKEAKDDILLLIDRSKITEKDESFEGVEKALSDLAKAKPWLLAEAQQQRRGTPDLSGNRNNNRNSNSNPEERTRIITSL